MSALTELWANYCRKKPKLKNPDAKVQMTAAQYYKALEMAFEEGRKEGLREGFEAAKQPGDANPFPDAFLRGFMRR